jgi:hypothetical protein
MGKTRIARTYADAVALIDGSADPFFSSSVTAKALAYQNYVNTGNPAVTINLRAWQFASAADCQTVYASLMNYPTYSSQPWVAGGLGDVSRIANSGGTWRVNVCKGAYLIESALLGAGGGSGQNLLVSFVNAILAKIP